MEKKTIVHVFHKMQDKRGRSAIDAIHAGVAKEDERRMNSRISEIYGVDLDEATDIHANYHAERILAGLERRAKENGMTKETLAARAQNLDVGEQAYQVAKGELAEAAAIDILFRGIYRIESNGGDNDRYVNFYG
jgi:hypothetical protein